MTETQQRTADPRRWWAVVALALALLAFGIDGTVLNLALPTLATDLHASTADLQWFVDAYSLVIAAVLLPAGMLGDRFGRKKFLLGALVVFGIASLLCAYSTGAGQLIAARVLLGLGAGFMFPLALSALPVLFSGEERTRAVSALTASTVLAYPIGPTLGGWLLTKFWWGSVFLINVPIVLIAGIAVLFLLPESRASVKRGFDVLGIALSSVALVGLTYGVIEAGEKGWGSGLALGPLLTGVALLIAFVLWEQSLARRGGDPLVELSLFRSGSFTWGTILGTLAIFAMFGLLFSVPQFFQAVEGRSALGAGVRLLPLILGLVVGSAFAEPMGKRTGAKTPVTFGFLLMVAGLILGARTTVTSGDGYIETWVGMIGIGLGFTMPTTMDAALGELSTESSGAGAAVIQAVRQVGGTFGVAVLGAALSSAYRSHLVLTNLPAQAADAVRKSASGGVAVAQRFGSTPLLNEVRSAFVHGTSVMLWVCGGIAAVAAVLTVLFLPNRGTLAADASPEDVERSLAANEQAII